MNNHMNPLNQTFRKIEYAPRAGLAYDIIARIREREIAIGKRRFWGFSALGIVSVGATIPAVMLLVSQVSQSGFLDYVSLAASPALKSSGIELASTVLSALPVTGIVAVLGALLVFAWSMRKAFVLPNPSLA
ncbi:MAG: hypothetical protein JWM20_638 [Patescibacteria group bacterium]|nr:hypothetical protein [Patescibacteria group bacterium]